MMKQRLFLLLALVAAMMAQAQVPQFSSRNFADWTYSNPAIELNASNILGNRIVLYTNSAGQHHMLTSPEFSCRRGEVIDMNITWITDQWQNSNFVVSKVALTAALIDGNGVAVDSVTYSPTTVSNTNHVNLSITASRGMPSARLRFASWRADVNSCGAVRQIAATSSLKGDVNGDGTVSVADINAIINVILSPSPTDEQRARADVDRDGAVTVADINAVIGVILG